MKTGAVLLLALLAWSLPVPQALADEESPQQAVQAILELYRARDYQTLLRERYTERHKAEAAGKTRELADKFARRLADEATYQKVISAYSECLEVEPVITDNPYPQVTETDKVALFSLEGGPFKLYLQKTGKWGFHM